MSTKPTYEDLLERRVEQLLSKASFSSAGDKAEVLEILRCTFAAIRTASAATPASASEAEITEFDRIEFALRDAGIGYDEAFRIAHMATNDKVREFHDVLRGKPASGEGQQGAPSWAVTPAAFKNFHRALCARFGYTHDEQFWWRDQVSLEEHIAAMTATQQQAGQAVGMITDPVNSALNPEPVWFNAMPPAGTKLYTTPQTPDGYVLVPREPTETMIAAFHAYDGTEYSNPFDADDFRNDFRAMIAASEASGGEVGGG